jgi:hypothetical protein
MATLYVGERLMVTLYLREGSTNIPMCFIKIYKESLPRNFSKFLLGMP